MRKRYLRGGIEGNPYEKAVTISGYRMYAMHSQRLLTRCLLFGVNKEHSLFCAIFVVGLKSNVHEPGHGQYGLVS